MDAASSGRVYSKVQNRQTVQNRRKGRPATYLARLQSLGGFQATYEDKPVFGD